MKNILNAFMNWFNGTNYNSEVVNRNDLQYNYTLIYNALYRIPNNPKIKNQWGNIYPPNHITDWCNKNNITYSIDSKILFANDGIHPRYQLTFMFKYEEDAVTCKLMFGED